MGRGLWLGNYKEQLIGINVWLCYHKRCMNYKLIENVSYYRQSLHTIKSSQKQITIYFLIDICNKTCWLINLTKQVFEKGHGPVEEGADIVRPFSPINFFFFTFGTNQTPSSCLHRSSRLPTFTNTTIFLSLSPASVYARHLFRSLWWLMTNNHFNSAIFSQWSHHNCTQVVRFLHMNHVGNQHFVFTASVKFKSLKCLIWEINCTNTRNTTQYRIIVHRWENANYFQAK